MFHELSSGFVLPWPPLRQCSGDEAGVALRSFVLDKGDSHLFEIIGDSVTADASGFQEPKFG